MFLWNMDGSVEALKARLQYKVETAALKVIAKTLETILDTGLRAAVAYGQKKL